MRIANVDRREERAARRFAAHRSWVRAFALLCCSPDEQTDAPPRPIGDVLVDVRQRVRKQPKLGATSSDVNLEQVRSSLINAWGTELLLAQALEVPDSDELARLVNQWAVVQAYYAVYHAVQALDGARGQRRPTNHTATQKRFASIWCGRSIDLAPWSLGAGPHGWRNHHGRAIDDSADHQSLATHETKWDLACQALRTTREKEFPDAYRRERIDLKKARRQEWRDEQERRVAEGKREQKQPKWWKTKGQLDPAQAETARRGVRTYSLLDYLYRLRISSNYDDAATFIHGPRNATVAREFTSDLVLIVSATMLVHEMHVTHFVGRSTMRDWVTSWTASAGSTPGGLSQRLDALRR